MSVCLCVCLIQRNKKALPTHDFVMIFCGDLENDYVQRNQSLLPRSTSSVGERLHPVLPPRAYDLAHGHTQREQP